MSIRNMYLGLVALLASCALGAPNDETSNQTSTATDQLPPTGSSTEHVKVTVTTTTTPPYVSPHKTGNSATGFATPLPPGSVTAPSDRPDYSRPTSTAVTLICPHPTEPCIIDGIPLWPSGTTSLVLPSFTYDPLPTSMASGSLPSAGSTMMTDTLATSASPTSPMGKSTTCSHTMSHIVPGNFSTDLPWTPELPWITRWETLSTPSGSLPTFSVLSSAASGIPATPLAIPIISGSNTSEFYWPTRSAIATNSSATSSASITPPNAKSAQASEAKVPVKVRDTASKASNISAMHSAILTLKSKYIDASDFRGMDNATPSAGRDEESKATKRRINYWTRFFAIAQPAGWVREHCLACDQEGEVTCLPDGKYTWCTDGCAVTLNLGCDMVCKEGTIRKEGHYCVR